MNPQNRIISIHVDAPDSIEGQTDRWVDVHATIVREHIAVHPTFKRELRVRSEQWTATHVPTGRYLCRAASESLAVAAAAAFARLPVDWGVTTEATAKQWQAELLNHAHAIRCMAAVGDLQALKESSR